MSRSRGKLHKCQICPWCGTRTLVRDGFDHGDHKSYHEVSYICSACFAGFSIRDSPRANFVNRMYQKERACRPPDESKRRKSLTYTIGDIYPPGSIRVKKVDKL